MLAQRKPCRRTLMCESAFIRPRARQAQQRMHSHAMATHCCCWGAGCASTRACSSRPCKAHEKQRQLMNLCRHFRGVPGRLMSHHFLSGAFQCHCVRQNCCSFGARAPPNHPNRWAKKHECDPLEGHLLTPLSPCCAEVWPSKLQLM